MVAFPPLVFAFKAGAVTVLFTRELEVDSPSAEETVAAEPT
jgi:hypothetical protein